MNSLLASTLSIAVPLRILDYEARGGPGAPDFERAREFGVVLASQGDTLLFGGKKGEAASMFNQVADAVAILSFCPGGVKLFGNHFVGRWPGGGVPTSPHTPSPRSDIQGSVVAFLERLRSLP